MPSILQFKDERIRDQWNSALIDERLKNVMRILALKFDGLRITCLIRTDEEQKAIAAIAKARGVPGPAMASKHLLLEPDRICRAADFNPQQGERSPETWRRRVKEYVDGHTNGVFCEIRDDGSAPHVHLAIDPQPGLTVELLA